MFDVIHVAPPWGTMHKVPGMSAEDLALLPVWMVAAPNAALFLWVPASLKYQAGQVFSQWGFHYVTTIYWDRPVPGAGKWFKPTVEELLVCIKGDVAPFGCQRANRIGTPPEAGGGKPRAFLKLIEAATAKMVPGRRLAIFEEEAVPGWQTVGRRGAADALRVLARQHVRSYR